MDERVAIVADDVETLKSRLSAWISGNEAPGIHCGRSGQGGGRVSPVQSSQVRPATESASPGKPEAEAIAERWVAGERVDWADVYQAPAPTKISLPTYPFARTRHWLTNAAGTSPTDVLHPLVTCNTSTLHETCFSSTLSVGNFYARDHRVGNDMVMPGAGMIEIACVAGNLAGERRVRRILDIAWVRPLVFRQRDATLRTVLHRTDDDVECAIMSYDEDNEAVAHCECKISYEPTVWSGDHGDLIAIPSLRERSMYVERGDDLYARFSEHGLFYGPAFRTIEQVHVGDGYALAQLRLPDISHTDHALYLLHPSLIDGALQSISVLIHGISPGAVYLPFLLQEIDIIHSLPRTCYAYAKFSDENRSDHGGIRKFDISILGENGSVLVTMKKLYVRAFAGVGSAMPSEVAT